MSLPGEGKTTCVYVCGGVCVYVYRCTMGAGRSQKKVAHPLELHSQVFFEPSSMIAGN